MQWLMTWTVWHWLVFGFSLLIAEILLPGVFLLWWGLAALVIAAVVALVPTLPLSIVIVGYALLAIILSLLWWKYQHGKDRADQAKTSLNQRDHAMLGLRGSVREMNDSGIGRGYFGDTTWRIQGQNLQVGDIVEVQRVEGITLWVRKVEK
ncbi:NfeD family protein [Necropsobacter massiliensis]|uniref:NfeD family protein n=1 Tax=Necropsobacter massiliensis TaxID=1400001 RepID=UPI0005962802|nr:NfeD family protein [Necropsobacter massiliensis]